MNGPPVRKVWRAVGSSLLAAYPVRSSGGLVPVPALQACLTPGRTASRRQSSYGYLPCGESAGSTPVQGPEHTPRR